MGQAAVIAFTQTLESETCFKCGVLFAMPQYLKRKAREGGNRVTFYCPNGHGQSYIETEIDRLKRQLEAKDAEIVRERNEASLARSRQSSAEHRERAAKGVTTRLKKRIAAGVCPCCHRTVSQLAQHMKTKHPDFPKGE